MDKKISFGFLVLLLVSVTKAVKINSITVPSRYELSHDENDTIRLDCDFSDLDPSEKGFVLKWYHNNVQIYQYIPSKNVPFALNSFKNRIDLSGDSSKNGDDRYKKHSSLVINKPLLTDSGNYTCTIQTFQSSARKTGEMQIIDPEDSIKLEYDFKPNNTVLFVCTVTKIYPVPTVKFLFNNEERDFLVETEKQLSDDGVTDIIIAANVSRNEIDDEIDVACEVTIPNSNYTKRETVVYDDPKLSTKILPGEITKLTQSEDDAGNGVGVLQFSFGLLMMALSSIIVSSNRI